MASSFSSLIRLLRPVASSPQAQRALFRPVRQRTFPIHERKFRATFTTSPTSIPPQAETSTSSSIHKPCGILSNSRNAKTCSAEPTQPPPPSAKAQNQPTYQLTFTCKPCKERSSHEISKQGYHNGTVLITCPQCKNRHVITDHLKVRYNFCFRDAKNSEYKAEGVLDRVFETMLTNHLSGRSSQIKHSRSKALCEIKESW